MTTSRALPASDVTRAHIAVVIAFAVNGFAYASFLSRTPSIRDMLGLTTPQMGPLLLCMSIGAVCGLPTSGPIVHRLGPARAVLAGAMSMTLGLGLLATGLLTGTVAFAAFGLFLCGLGTGVWDVAMNVEGADVERRLGRSIMPRLHAAFSLGTVAGAGVGATAAAIGLPLPAQIFGMAVIVPITVGIVHRRFLEHEEAPAEEKAKGSGVLAVWKEPRTLLVGLMTLAFAFTEGSANDWIAFALTDGYGRSETVGAVAFGLFVIAMTIGRGFGGTLLDRFGRVAVLRVTALLALAGLLLVLFGGSPVVALAGALLWGLGASLGFPVGMSAGADDPAKAAARVSVISSVAYTAFIAGPPLIGLLAAHVGILFSLLVVVGALVLGLLASGAARPLAPAADDR